MRFKHVANLVAGGTPATDDPANWADDAGLPWVTISDMTRERVVTTTERRVTEAGAKSKRLPVGQPGTTLLAMYASVGETAVLGTRAAWNQAIVGIQPRHGRAHARFVGYWLAHLRPELAGLSRSTTQDNLNAEQVANLPFPEIPIDGQRKIAKFLDSETARIDALVEKKRQLIELLLEKRGSVLADGIQGHFTGGEPSAARLPWMDVRPIHWNEAKLTLVARLGSGHTPSRDHPEWWEDCSIPWITTGEVAQMRSDRIEFVTETREMISELGLANSAAQIHPAGTLVLCRTAASAGYSAIMGRDMATSQDFATWTCGPLLRPRFLLLCLRVMRQDLLGRLAMGSTHQTIYMPDIEAIRVPLPPIEEQDRIVEEVWRRLRAIDDAIDPLARQLDVLVERRQAVITAAVTGELGVAKAA